MIQIIKIKNFLQINFVNVLENAIFYVGILQVFTSTKYILVN